MIKPSIKPLIIIPSRLESNRLPQKPLKNIKGKPLIVHSWERAIKANIGDVLVASPDQDILDAIKKQGGKACLTPSDCPSGTDRVFYCFHKLDNRNDYNVIINLQGDMLDVRPHHLSSLLALMEDECDMATLAYEVKDKKATDNPCVVKAIISFDDKTHKTPPHKRGKGIYFTRAKAPFYAPCLFGHIGIYAYRPKSLELVAKSPASLLEQQEKLEQLRALEAGFMVRVGIVEDAPFSIDTQDDLDQARAL